MDDDRFAWVRQQSEVIDSDHPDYETLIELDDVERWIAEGAPSPDPAPPIPTTPKAVEVPAVALCVSRDEAATLLSVSPDHFERHVLPDLRVVQLGRRQVIRVRDLEDFLAAKAARALR